MKKIIVLFFIIVLAISLTSCISGENNSTEEKEVKITSMVRSIGGVKDEMDNYDRQVLSYEVTLLNYEERDVYIKSITPILEDRFAQKVEDKNVEIEINKLIKPKEAIQVNGEIIFNSKGMSKEEILEMEPFFNKFKISIEKEINVK